VGAALQVKSRVNADAASLSYTACRDLAATSVRLELLQVQQDAVGPTSSHLTFVQHFAAEAAFLAADGIWSDVEPQHSEKQPTADRVTRPLQVISSLSFTQLDSDFSSNCLAVAERL
jgi:hypothetical protein